MSRAALLLAGVAVGAAVAAAAPAGETAPAAPAFAASGLLPGAAPGAANNASAAAAAGRPNVLFLFLDDMDASLGATSVMPHYTQRFITEGMTFSRAYVSSPKCCPSRTALFTGRFPHRLNDTAYGWCGDVVANKRYDATFAVPVQAAGYTTGYFGKLFNDMGDMCKPGVMHVPAGFDGPSDYFLGLCKESVYYSNPWNDNGTLYTTGASGGENYLQAYLGNKTLPWLRAAAAAAAAGGPPFFAVLAPHAPHFVAEPAPWHLNAPLPAQQAPRLPSYNASGAGKNWAVRQNPPLNAFMAANVDRHFRNRHRTLLSVDDYVHDVFAALEAAGVLDNTYVIASSDQCVWAARAPASARGGAAHAAPLSRPRRRARAPRRLALAPVARAPHLPRPPATPPAPRPPARAQRLPPRRVPPAL